MAAIRCKACGRTYDYAKEGFCPKCGAYNRPPRREWVDAEGDIHYAGTDKVCYEEQARRARPKTRWNVRHGAEPKSPTGIVFTVLAACIIAVCLIVARSNISILDRVPAPDYPNGWQSGAEASAEAIEALSEGEVFTLDGGTFLVAHKQLYSEGNALLVYVVEEGDYQIFPHLMWLDDYGAEMRIFPDDVTVSASSEGVFLCTYDLTGADMAQNLYLAFEGVNETVYVLVDLSNT